MSANRLREYRQQAGLSQVQLAIKSKVSRLRVHMCESGYTPALSTQTKLALALGVSPEDVFPERQRGENNV